jgi:DNA end-binding protein Ku
MRAIWKGAVSFGLVTVPVRVFGATQEHDIRFHQVHRVDGGRIRLKRVCTVCDEEVPYDQLAKGYESADGRAVILTDDDFAGLPLSTDREIAVLEFVPIEQVDPILFDRTYYLGPEAWATTPYVLLREALEATNRMAVVQVALRQRETLAVLRVRERIIVMQTLLWPDEVRAVDFDVPGGTVDVQPQELAMAEALVESLSADFAPEAYEGQYAKAVASLVEAKLQGAEPPSTPPGAQAASGDMVDLLTALQASVERARAARGEAAPQPPDAAPAPGEKPARRRSSRTSASESTAEPATERPARKAATKTGTKARAAKGTEPAQEETTPKSATAESATKKAAAKKARPRKSA